MTPGLSRSGCSQAIKDRDSMGPIPNRQNVAGQYLTIAEVAQLLKLSPRTVRRLVAAGKLPPPIRLTGRIVRFDVREINEYLARQKHAKARRGVSTEGQVGIWRL